MKNLLTTSNTIMIYSSICSFSLSWVVQIIALSTRTRVLVSFFKNIGQGLMFPVSNSVLWVPFTNHIHEYSDSDLQQIILRTNVCSNESNRIETKASDVVEWRFLRPRGRFISY